MLGNRSQAGAGLGISLGCCSIWCSWLSGDDNEKRKIGIWYQIPNRMLLPCQEGNSSGGAGSCLAVGILDEALVGAPLGLPAPFGQETGTLFLVHLRVTVASCLLGAEKPDILS